MNSSGGESPDTGSGTGTEARGIMTSWRNEPRAQLLAVAFLTIVGAIYRLAFLWQPAMHDEASNYIYFAAPPLSFGLSHYPYPNNQLLSTFFVHLATRALGDSPAAMRFPAFLAGIALIPLTYFVVRRLYDGRVGLLAAALVVPAGALVAYSTNARAYGMQAVLFLALVLCASHIIKGGGWGWWAGLVVAGALGFYAVPTMLYFFGAVALWMLVSALRGDTWSSPGALITRLAGACILTAGLSALLYTPVFATSGIHGLVSTNWVAPLSWSDFFGGIGGILRDYWWLWSMGITSVIGVILAAGVVLSAVFHRRIRSFKVNLLWPVLGWCIALMVIQRVLPPPRVWLPLLPLFFGFSAAGLLFAFGKAAALLREKKPDMPATRSTAVFPLIMVLIAVLLGAPLLVGRAPYQPSDQVRLRDALSITRYLKGQLREGDVVYIEQNVRKLLEYYFMREGVPQSYLYFMPGEPSHVDGPWKRAFVVDAKAEGAGYSAEHALELSNLAPGIYYSLTPLAAFERAGVYRVENPEFDVPAPWR